MVFKVFVDTNVILDIFLKREPFFDNSQKLVLEIPGKNFIPLISSSSVTDIYYICKKSGMEKDVILEKLKELLKTFEVLIIDKDSINNALLSDLKDFEDAVQMMACKITKYKLHTNALISVCSLFWSDYQLFVYQVKFYKKKGA